MSRMKLPINLWELALYWVAAVAVFVVVISIPLAMHAMPPEHRVHVSDDAMRLLTVRERLRAGGLAQRIYDQTDDQSSPSVAEQ